MKKIIKYPNQALKEVCSEVTEFNTDIHQLLVEMSQIMVDAKGMGLAANQIGVLNRILVMKDLTGRIWEIINPIITERSEERILETEGCLSAPGVYVQISRHKMVNLEYQDKDGDRQFAVFMGIEAVCIQHEVDHLDGIFYIEKLNRQQRRSALRSIK